MLTEGHFSSDLALAEIPSYSDDWDKVSKFVFRGQAEDRFTIDEVMLSGVTVKRYEDRPTLFVSIEEVYDIINIVKGSTNGLVIWETNFSSPGNIILSGVTNTFSPSVLDTNKIYKIGFSADRYSHLVVTNDTRGFFHKLTIDGKELEYSENTYTIDNGSILIRRDFAQVGSIVELEYLSVSKTDPKVANVRIPDTQVKNATNELLTEFTIGDTLPHWNSIKNSVPAFISDAVGLTGKYYLYGDSKLSGKIFVYDSSNIFNDITYTSKDLDISSALTEQAYDYERYKTTIGNIAARIFKSTSEYTSIADLYTATIREYNFTKQGTLLYKEQDYVPESLAKLGLGKLVKPYVDSANNVIVCHDGSVYPVRPAANLVDMTSPRFDAAASIVYSNEKKLYGDILDHAVQTTNVNYLMPSVNRSTWFTISMMDEYVEKFFKKWNARSEIEYGYGADENGDGTDWNYSALVNKGYAEYSEFDKLPGHWRGAYEYIFGTSEPHREPWVMLGLNVRPENWGDTYPERAGTINTWNDATKVQNLVDSLVHGYFGDGDTDSVVAKWDWQWSTRMPVDSDGNLVARNLILDPTELLTDAEKYSQFVYGDWWGEELIWRLGANGRIAMLDAVIKLNPSKGMYLFLQPNNTKTNFEFDLFELDTTDNSGVYQALRNHITRNNYGTDLDRVYKNIDTHLTIKMGGFTNKNLINLSTESSSTGKFKIEDEDYSLVMYRGTSHELVTASSIKFTKKDVPGIGVAYVIDGFGPNKQQFKFYPHVDNGNNDFTSVDVNKTGTTVKKFKKFAKVANILPYGSAVQSIQDVYNFIRGYYAYLEDNGYVLEQHKDAVALRFTRWAITANTDTSYTSKIGNKISYTNTHAYVEEVNTLPLGANSVILYDGTEVPASDLIVTRDPETTFIELKLDENIGALTVSAVDYEHAIIVNDVTTFNKKICDKETGLKHRRLKLKARRTSDWKGKKSAPGFLVFEDNILQNFDSNVSESENFYSYNIEKFNAGVQKAENIAIGNIDRDWINELGLENNTIGKFYQGIIRDKGTNDSINRLERTDIINMGTSDISIDEEWMFNQSYYGDATGTKSAEYEIRQQEIRNRTQVVKFDKSGVANFDDDILVLRPTDNMGGYARVVNDTDLQFDYLEYEQSNKFIDLPTAGELTKGEADYIIRSLSDLPDTFDNSADYATIDSWSDTTSYKKGDRVRYKGSLYQCVADYIQLSRISESITLTGTARNAIFPSGTTANIQGTNITFGKSSTRLLDINVSSDSDVVPFDSFEGAQIVLDGNIVNIENLENQVIINKFPSVLGLQSNPVIADRKDQTLVITVGDGSTAQTTTVNFTDPNVSDFTQNETASSTFNTTNNIEDILGVVGQSTYTILGSFTSVTGATVDGVAEAFTLNGNDITFTDAVFLGGEDIEVTLQTVTEIKQTQFTINQTLGQVGDYVYEVAAVRVNGNTITNYSIAGQTLTIPAGVNDGVSVQIDIHVVSSAVLSDIVSAINTQVSSIAGLAAQDDAGRLRITYTIPDVTKINASLTIESTGTTNAVLGFGTDPFNETSDTATPYVFYGQAVITAETVANSINTATNLTNIVAESVNNRLRITKSNITVSDNTLVINGNTLPQLHISSNIYTASSVIEQVENTAAEAVAIINNSLIDAGETEIQASLVDGSIRIVCDTPVLDMGDNTHQFNNIAGLPYGVQENINTSIENQFNASEWQNIDAQDPALYSIWTSTDAGLEYDQLGPSGQKTQIKYNNWNLFQTMNMGWFTTDTDSNGMEICSICAGTATSDGNDAQVTLNSDHNLRDGDYVMLLNTTTVPNIDGIHRVTRISPTNGTQFYIDRFIEECGKAEQVFVIRPVRFPTISGRDLLISEQWYNLKAGDIVFTNTDSANNLSSNVFAYNGNGFDYIRKTAKRPSNVDLVNIRIYDGESQETSIELEVYDPMRGIIPGVADREITFKSPIDMAVYTNSTSEYFTEGAQNSWGDAEQNKVWWDISKVRYYDYDQGDYSYRVSIWGKQILSSTVDVYEWTKSSVTPDLWEEAVSQGTIMYGQPATGEAYRLYDQIADDYTYYYSEYKEWDSVLGKYVPVYYFWVKNKTTINDPARTLSVFDIAAIINDPTGSGINWCAVVDNDTIIISNTREYINNTSSVIQLNKAPKGIAHNSWTAIREKHDLIPDFWYMSARNNLVGYNASEVSGEILLTTPLPDLRLNKFNRYGNDVNIGQGWFTDVFDARREALQVANRLVSTINVHNDLYSTWFRNLTKHQVSNTWDWVDWVDPRRNPTQLPTIIASSRTELFRPEEFSEHNVVKFEVPGDDQVITATGITSVQSYEMPEYADSIERLSVNGVEYIERRDWVRDYKTITFYNENTELGYGIDIQDDDVIEYQTSTLTRDEIYERIDGSWMLVEKKNSTIKFNDIVSETARKNAWDMQGWDIGPWDYTYAEATFYIIKALREDIFVGNYVDRFNQWFLGVIDFAISSQTQVDWVYKTTYVNVNIETPINTTARKYVKNNVNELAGYITTIKPFHTKIKSVYDKNYADESIAVGIGEDQRMINVEVKFEDYMPSFSGNTVESGWNTEEFIGAPMTFISDDFDNELSGDEFNNVDMFNWDYEHGARRTLLNVGSQEHLAIEVSTNTSGSTVDNNSRTFVYLQDDTFNISAYALRPSNYTVLTSEISPTDTIIDVDDSSVFNVTGGKAYINGEVIVYGQAQDNQLLYVQREREGSYGKLDVAGTGIYNIADEALTTDTDIKKSVNNDNYRTQAFINDVEGISILDPLSKTILSKELQGIIAPPAPATPPPEPEVPEVPETPEESQVSVDPFSTSVINDLGSVQEITTPNGTQILYVADNDTYYELTFDRTGVGSPIEEVLLSNETAAGDTMIFVYDSDADLPDSGYCYMDGEIWYYGSKVSNIVFSDVQRGQLGTIAKDHPYPRVGGGYTQVYYINDKELDVALDGTITYVNDGTELIIE